MSAPASQCLHADLVELAVTPFCGRSLAEHQAASGTSRCGALHGSRLCWTGARPLPSGPQRQMLAVERILRKGILHTSTCRSPRRWRARQRRRRLHQRHADRAITVGAATPAWHPRLLPGFGLVEQDVGFIPLAAWINWLMSLFFSVLPRSGASPGDDDSFGRRSANIRPFLV